MKFICECLSAEDALIVEALSSALVAAMVLLMVGGRLQRGLLHHAQDEASLIPAEKETNLDNELQWQVTSISKGGSWTGAV